MTLDRISWPLRTERLTIRPATTDDLESLGRIQRDVERRPLYTIEEEL